MIANRPAFSPSWTSDLARLDAHTITPAEYDELPELTDEMLARARINKGGRPLSASPRKLISLRLPAEVIERWRATGPGWQTRMAERLAQPLEKA
ncbi:BrnA antitoxin family protein [Amphibiibacter pelophylacis]|uniref:BrnA antitoxin family protein n=1 Tax=Amphibiibacter pelophylacis TaxID=1799477 RepID=A0ACC6NZW5_9BURK